MLTSSIQVLGISAEDPHAESPLRLHGRVTVLDQNWTFDTVRISLKGAIRTQIGTRVAIEALPSSTVIKRNLDFKPTYSQSQQTSEEQHLDFDLPLPSSSAATTTSVQKSSSPNVSPNGFIPSMAFTASTHVTRVTALKDRHLVEGSCRVIYYLEADLLRVETKQVIRKLTCPVDISSLHVPLDVEVSNQTGEAQLEQVVKPNSRRLSRVFSSQVQPQVSIKMARQLGTISSASAKSVLQTRHLSVPVDVTLDLPAGTAQSELAALEADNIVCSVKAHWYTSRTFATTSISQSKATPYSNAETLIRNTTVSMQKLQANLPPLYKSSPHQRDSSSAPSKYTYTTSMMVDLVLPESVTSPSIATDLLNINYALNLSMKFKFGNESLVRACTAEFHLPVTLSTANPASILRMRDLEPLSGFVEQGLVFAPPPYIA